MFVREKKFGNNRYFYLVKNFRDGEKVRQKVVKYLGKKKPSKKEIEKLKERFKAQRTKQKQIKLKNFI